MTTSKRPFNSHLDRALYAQSITHEVMVYHKNGKPLQSISYSSSFSVDEIFTDIQNKYSNKNITIETVLS